MALIGHEAETNVRREAAQALLRVRVVVAGALVCGVLIAFFGLPWWAGTLAFAGLSAAAFWPVRDPARGALLAERARRPAGWPDTGMKLLVEALPEPAVITDRRGVVRYANRLASERLGPLRAADPLSFRLRVPALHAALDRVVRRGEPERVAWSEKVPTERWYAAHLALVRLPGEAGEDFVLLVVADETERHLAERMRADFVANASHELRTPLASLTGFIETLLGPARNDTAARERFLAIMLDQAARMKRLIDDLLSLTRIEMRAHLRPETVVDLVPLVRHVCDALGPLARESGVALEATFEQAAMPVQGDRDELIQVFSNLVENAIKYGGSGGRVDIRAAAERPSGPATARTWTVAVTDYGPGIAPEHLPRLTERFYRADVETSRQNKGTGLGLAIVKHILARHRGRLAIDSAPGRGATFLVRLEAAEDVAPAGQGIEGTQKPVSRS